MTSEKQLAANRRNAQKSTGPTSPEGKAASSMNALKTGIHAKSAIIPGENADDLQLLTNEYYDFYRPANPIARGLVDDLIRCEWTLRRMDTAEASHWTYQDAEAFRPIPKAYKQGKIVAQSAKTLAAIQRRIDSARRGRDRALLQLHSLAANPLPAPASPPATPQPAITSNPNGFVPSTSPNGPETSTQAPANPQKSPDSPHGPSHILHI